MGTFDRVARFLAVGEFVRAKHVEAGFPPDRISVRPNFAWDAPIREGPGEHFVFAGRLAPEKGIDTLIKIWRAEWPPLLVIGDGPLRSELEPAAPGVRFLGQVEPSRVMDLLGRARALLLPAPSFEAHPRVIAEACAQGVPVVGSRLGGVEEAIADDVSGILVPPDDPGGWADAVGRLLADDESERLGRGARHLWRARYSPERGIESLEQAYASVTAMAGRR
jgi:glycosyltransferase involved in cell wall biosynthesis